MKLRHPHIQPPVLVEVAPERVASHIAAGWIPDEAPAPSTEDTTDRPRRRRAGSDSTKETAQ